MRILGFGTYDLTRHPRVGIVLDGLRSQGDDVVELNEPLGFTTAERVEMLRHPHRVYRLLVRLLQRWLALIRLTRTARRTGRIDAVIVGYMGQFDVILARLLFPRGFIVLDLMIFGADTARDRGMTTGLKVRALHALDALAVRCGDLVMLDTDEQVELLSESQRHKAVVVAVGAPTAWFEAGAGRASVAVRGELKVIFFGLYTPLQGATVIGRAQTLLAEHPEITFTMIGTGQDYAETRRLGQASANTTWLDWLDSDELPKVTATHDVCLGIFGDTPKALRVVPNKVYQGAAAGCVIVTSDTPAQRRTLGDAAVFVSPADPRALADALLRLSTDSELASRLSDAARTVAAERFTPHAIVEPLRARLVR